MILRERSAEHREISRDGDDFLSISVVPVHSIYFERTLIPKDISPDFEAPG